MLSNLARTASFVLKLKGREFLLVKGVLKDEVPVYGVDLRPYVPLLDAANIAEACKGLPSVGKSI